MSAQEGADRVRPRPSFCFPNLGATSLILHASPPLKASSSASFPTLILISLAR